MRWASRSRRSYSAALLGPRGREEEAAAARRVRGHRRRPREARRTRLRHDRGPFRRGRRPGHRRRARARPASLRAQGFTVKAPYGEIRSRRAANPFPATSSATAGTSTGRGGVPGRLPEHLLGRHRRRGQPGQLKTWYGRRRQHPDLVPQGHLRRIALRRAAGGLPRDHRGRQSGDAASRSFYDSTQHARESLAAELERRLFQYVLAHSDDPGLRDNRTSCATPSCGSSPWSTSGRAATTRSCPRARACGARRWRDNDGDDQITNVDGVDPEPATSRRSGATTRKAPTTTSSPTTTADPARSPSPRRRRSTGLMARLRRSFLLGYRRYGPLILSPEGWPVTNRQRLAPP